MNKTFSLVLNGILVIAVAVLYYLHFSCAGNCKAETAAAGTDSTAKAKPAVLAPKDIKASRTVYVNIDVLNEKYKFFKDLAASVEAEQRSYESKYQQKAEKFQQDYADLQQKAQQGLLSENQLNAAQEDLAKRKEELDQLQVKSQQLMEQAQERNADANQKLRDYIKEYNKNAGYSYVLAYASSGQVLFAADSLDITDEIVDGLNKQYDEGKKKK